MADQTQQPETRIDINELLIVLGDKELRLYAMQKKIAELEREIQSIKASQQPKN